MDNLDHDDDDISEQIYDDDSDKKKIEMPK
jgi:hypothetical protein